MLRFSRAAMIGALVGLVSTIGGSEVVRAAPATASTDTGAILPELTTAVNELRDAKGASTYAALRGLWRTWDRVDPAQVEEALAAFSEAKTTTAPARVYADLLLAYARKRRGDLDGARTRVAKLGFVEKWMIVGPFDNAGKTGFLRPFAPELEQNEGIDLGRTYDGKERPVKWRTLAGETGTLGWFDFGQFLRPRDLTCSYAASFVKPKAGTRENRKVSLWIGSAGAIKVFWNGEQVLEDAGYRDIDIDRFATTVSLAPGNSRLLVKVCGDDEAPRFTLRIADEKGAPDLGVELSADPRSSEPSSAVKIAKPKATKPALTPKPAATPKPAVVQVPKQKPGGPVPVPPNATAPRPNEAEEVNRAAPAPAPPKPKNGIEGPIQIFEREIAGAKPTAASLEAYARYLAMTGGDSKPEHKARDLARRAAEAEPTVKRLLLAGQLAEDRNQMREWTDKARAMLGKDDLEILFAEAQLARTGPNWREAVPIYERMLKIDPDNVNATLGLVELQIEAGLKRTAQSTLQKAVERRPSSVALLRVYASELRAVGLDTDADEVEARYSALRFDDAGFLNQKVDLAVARRDTAGAERWLARFLKSEPETSFAHSVAARTYRSLGQEDRALASYRRALEIAPEDVSTLRALSDFYGETGKGDEQLRLLRQILAVSPQAKEVREYVEHIEPPKPRVDEAYAWSPDKFLPLRSAPAAGFPKRTLRNLTVSTVFANGLSTHFHQVVFQPLTDEAAAQAREYAFGYQSDRQIVTLRAAKVYRADGKIDEAIESGEGGANDPSLQMYTSTRVFYVHFPRLNTGDVIELRYRIEDVAGRNEVGDYFGEVEYLGNDEPTANAEYVLVTPKARTFYVDASTVPKLQRDSKEEGDSRIYRFFVPELDAIAGEPSMPPFAEIAPHIHVSTFKTWDDMGAFYWGLAKDQFDVDDEVRKVVKEVTKGLTDQAAKVKAIYKYATQTRYVALEFGLEGIKPRRCAQTLARGWGDCKDKATLIVSMLREIGVPATIVLVRTQMRGGFGSDPASMAPFDHAIAYVPSMDLYLDGTAEHSGSTELPVMDRNALALQVNEGKPKLVHLPDPPPEASKVTRKLDMSLAPDGAGSFALDMTVTGAYAPEWRSRYLAEDTRKDRAIRDFGGELGSLEIANGKSGVETNDLDDEEQPVHLKVKGKSLAFARKDGDILSVPAGPAHALVRDLASLSKRTQDVVVHAKTLREDEWTIHLPAGMKVTRAVTAAHGDTPFGAYSIAVEESAGKVVVKTSLSFKKTRIAPSEYAAFRAFCEEVDKAFGQRLWVGK